LTPPPVRRRHLLRVAALAAVLAASFGRVTAAAMERCDSTTPLTIVGVDTRAERLLLAPPVKGDAPGWLFELDLRNASASAWPEPDPTARFAGSSGPGPILAARRCGEQCLQIVRFEGGAWQPLGEPLLASAGDTVNATWDADGNAWVVLHGARGPQGIAAQAYRLAGRDWKSAGSLPVSAVGNPGALAAPAGESGVVSGNGQFAVDARPRHWWATTSTASLAHGELLWLGGPHAALLTADAQLEVTDDGHTWQPVRWLPWTSGEGDLSWKPGRDYWVELPEGDREPPLVAVWTDARVAGKPRSFIAHREADGTWKNDVALPPGILTSGGERLPFNQMVRFPGERWVLLTGCVARESGAALALRRIENGTLRDPELVPIQVESKPSR